MKYFLLEVSYAEPRQFRVTAVEGGKGVATALNDTSFEPIGVYGTIDSCMNVLSDYLKMEHSK